MTHEELLQHIRFLNEAIKEARKSVQAGHGGPFGAVIVKDGKIMARGHNRVTSSDDPTAHAEIVTIRKACKKLKNFELKGCTIYSSCEPCPMCLGAIYWTRLDALFYAADRNVAADANFDDADIYKEIPLTPKQRTLPTTRIELPGYHLPFDDWNAKKDKTEY